MYIRVDKDSSISAYSTTEISGIGGEIEIPDSRLPVGFEEGIFPGTWLYINGKIVPSGRDIVFENAKAEKFAELSSICNQMIEDGIDVETANGKRP